MEDSKTKKEEYYSNLANQLSGVSPQNNNASSGSQVGSDDNYDYYEALKNESYKTMLSKEVQASNARDQALKYTKNALRSNGYGTQGVSESTLLGIGNAYNSALKSAQSDYENSLLSINQQQKEAESDNFESLTTLMGSASGTEQLSEMLNTYGYMNEDGTWNEEALSKLDTNTRNQLVTLYNMYSSEFASSEWLSDYTINGTGYRDSGTAIQNLATADGSLGNVDNELKYIFSDSYLANREDGDCVKLVNSKDSNKYIYMIFKNGSWYQTTGTIYSKAKNKEEIKGK